MQGERGLVVFWGEEWGMWGMPSVVCFPFFHYLDGKRRGGRAEEEVQKRCRKCRRDESDGLRSPTFQCKDWEEWRQGGGWRRVSTIHRLSETIWGVDFMNCPALSVTRQILQNSLSFWWHFLSITMITVIIWADLQVYLLHSPYKYLHRDGRNYLFVEESIFHALNLQTPNHEDDFGYYSRKALNDI